MHSLSLCLFIKSSLSTLSRTGVYTTTNIEIDECLKKSVCMQYVHMCAVCIHVCSMYACMYELYMYPYKYVCTYIHMYACIHEHKCIHTYVCILTSKENDYH